MQVCHPYFLSGGSPCPADLERELPDFTQRNDCFMVSWSLLSAHLYAFALLRSWLVHPRFMLEGCAVEDVVRELQHPRLPCNELQCPVDCKMSHWKDDGHWANGYRARQGAPSRLSHANLRVWSNLGVS